MSNLIIDYIQKELLSGAETIDLLPEDELLGSGLIDSLGIMKLIQFIETSYEVKIPPEDMVIENFITVEAIENYLQTLKAV